jgi:hypothetical protein
MVFNISYMQASPGARVSSSFFFICGVCVVQLSFFEKMFHKSSRFIRPTGPPSGCLNCYLFGFWSGSQTIPLTKVLRLLPPLNGSTRPASPAWLSQGPSDLSGLDQDDPPLAWCSPPPPPDWLEDHLIWVDSTKMTPLWLDAGCPLNA